MRFFVGLILGVLPLLARAASLDVDPIRVTFSGQNTVAVVTLSNAGDTPATVQLQTVSWTQDKGEDVYAPTRDVLATPPIFTVPGHQKQIIRLGLRVPADATVEKTYRLYLQEVPAAQQTQGLGVVMALRIGVPVFVEPLAPAKPVLQWTARRVSDNELDLSVANTGGKHVQLRQISLSGPQHLSLVVQQAAYVLPGKARTWVLKHKGGMPAVGTKLQVDSDTDAGIVNGELVVQ